MIIKLVIWLLAMGGVLLLLSMLLPHAFAASVLFTVSGIAFTGYLCCLSACGFGLAAVLAR